MPAPRSQASRQPARSGPRLPGSRAAGSAVWTQPQAQTAVRLRVSENWRCSDRSQAQTCWSLLGARVGAARGHSLPEAPAQTPPLRELSPPARPTLPTPGLLPPALGRASSCSSRKDPLGLSSAGGARPQARPGQAAAVQREDGSECKPEEVRVKGSGEGVPGMGT
uniref:Uncharacterized protein n=1 Tax=Pipistrellus kuhlii TaxID=59472 RepID=A0A7J7T0K3_PIPKU|nr:hypothetical protein mPipKuh1_009742 [Pipistrellus kuhlii]